MPFRTPALLLATAGVVAAALPLGPASAQAAVAPYSARTELGVLMDDPAALPILQRHVPAMMANKDIGKGRGYSLRFLSGYDKSLKAALPEIERELAALPGAAAER